MQQELYLADAYQMKGNYADSVEEFAKSLELAGDKTIAALAREFFSNDGWNGYLMAMIDNSHRSPHLNAVRLSFCHVALGDKDGAIRELNKAYNEGITQVRELKADSRFDRLRDDPRFHELYRKLGLP